MVVAKACLSEGFSMAPYELGGGQGVIPWTPEGKSPRLVSQDLGFCFFYQFVELSKSSAPGRAAGGTRSFFNCNETVR